MRWQPPALQSGESKTWLDLFCLGRKGCQPHITSFSASQEVSLGAEGIGMLLGRAGTGVGRGAEAPLARQGPSPDTLASPATPTPQGTHCSWAWVALKEGPDAPSFSSVCQADS